MNEPLIVGPERLRGFLLAQLHWEQYRRLRIVLVYAAALAGALSWAPPLRGLFAAISCACFSLSLGAGMMEWRWSRRRDRCGEGLSRG